MSTKKRTWAPPPAAACLLALLAVAPGAPARAAELLDERIDISVEKAAAADLFRSFAEIASLTLDMDPAVQGTVSLRVERVRLGTALQAACESLNCRFKLADGRLRIEALPAATEETIEKGITAGLDEPIDLKVSAAKAQDLLATFAHLLGAELDLDPAVSGTVALSLEGVPCRKALDEVCGQLGCSWEQVAGAEKPVLRVKAKR